jgi:hypothetical protein
MTELKPFGVVLLLDVQAVTLAHVKLLIVVAVMELVYLAEVSSSQLPKLNSLS